MAGSAVELATAYVSISASTKGLGRDVAKAFGDKPMGQIGASAGKSITGRLGSTLKKGAIGVGAAAGGVLATALFKGWNRLTNIENATKKLEGLGHTTKSVKSIMDNALASVKGTAFGLDEAATTAAGVVAAGIKPGKDLERILKTVADTATIAGTSMGDMGTIFGSVAARGKLQGDDLLQLQSKGVPVLAMLAKHYKITAAEASTMVTKGKVDFQSFAAAMGENLGGAALKSGETTQGAFKNMMAALGRFGASLLGGVFPLAKTVFGGITTLVDNLGARIGPFVEKFSTGIQGLFALVGKGDYTNALSKSLGIEEDSVIVDKILNIRDAVADFYAGITLADPESIGAPLEGWVAKGQKVRDMAGWLTTAAADLWAGLTMDSATRAEFEGALSGAVDLGARLRAVFDGLVEVGKALWPALVTIGSALMAAGQQLGVSTWQIFLTLLDLAAAALSGLVPLIESAAKWLSENERFVQGLALGFVAYRTAVLGATIVTNGISLATKAWTGAQKLLNMVMNASPMGRAIQIISLLVGAFVTAYTTSETFRNIVNGVWEAVRGAVEASVGWIVNTAWPWLQVAFDAIVGAVQAVGGFFSSIWSAITSAVSTAWGVISGIFSAITGFLSNVFGPILRTYLGIWQFVFKAIQIVVLAVWKLAIQPTFSLMVAGFKAVGGFFQSVYANVIKPTWDALGAAIRWVWDNTIKWAFDKIKQGAGWVSDKFQTVKGLIAAAWQGLQSPLQATWKWIDDKVFGAIKKGVDLVKVGFELAKDGIKKAWDALKAIAQAPIKFIIETVLNNGLIKGFNWLSGKIGGPKIDPIPLPFATGGVLPGWSPGRDVHQFYSPTGGRLALSGGEAIMRPEFTRLVGGPGGVDRLNAMARSGRLPFQQFAGGGVIGWIKSKASSAFDWVRNKAGAIWEAISDPVKFFASKLPAMDTAKTIGRFGEAAVLKVKDIAVDKVKNLWSTFTGAFKTVEAQNGNTPGALPANARGLSFRPGVKLDQNTINRLVMAAAQVPMRVIQGSWQNYHLSAGTHLGSGAADIVANNWYGAVEALRRNGLLAMFRNWPGNQHIHMLNPNVSGLSSAAQSQVATARRNNGIFKDGGVLKPLLFDSGGVLPVGDSWVRNATGRPEPLARVDQQGGVLAAVVEALADLERAVYQGTRDGASDGIQGVASTASRQRRQAYGLAAGRV